MSPTNLTQKELKIIDQLKEDSKKRKGEKEKIIAYITKNYQLKNVRQIAEDLGWGNDDKATIRVKNAVKKLKKNNKITKKEKGIKPEERMYLLTNYLSKSYRQIAEDLGWGNDDKAIIRVKNSIRKLRKEFDIPRKDKP